MERPLQPMRCANELSAERRLLARRFRPCPIQTSAKKCHKQVITPHTSSGQEVSLYLTDAIARTLFLRGISEPGSRLIGVYAA
jgi:hypothetical protein